MPRKFFRRKRRNARKYRRTLYKRGNYKPKTFYFKRTFTAEQDVYDYTGVTHFVGNGVSGNYRLAQLPNYTEFTNLFDQYKIAGVQQKFVYSANSQDPSSTSALPMLGFIHDYDDGTALSSLNDYLQYPNHKVYRMDKPVIKTFFRPKSALAVYSGAFTSYARNNNWIDVGSPSVEHYGLKWYIDPMIPGIGSNVIGKLRIYITVYLKMKNVR